MGQRVREVRPTAHESIAGGELEQLGVNRAFGEPAVSRQRRDKGRIPAEHHRSDTILRQIEVVDERVARILRRRQAMSVQHRRRAVDYQKHIEGDAPAGEGGPTDDAHCTVAGAVCSWDVVTVPVATTVSRPRFVPTYAKVAVPAAVVVTSRALALTPVMAK